MTVYLLHFERPYPNGRQPQHYLGYAADLDVRLAQHRAGRGARLIAVIRERGIAWRVARVWPGGDRGLERRLKGWKKSRRLCPDCRPSLPVARLPVAA